MRMGQQSPNRCRQEELSFSKLPEVVAVEVKDADGGRL